MWNPLLFNFRNQEVVQGRAQIAPNANTVIYDLARFRIGLD